MKTVELFSGTKSFSKFAELQGHEINSIAEGVDKVWLIEEEDE